LTQEDMYDSPSKVLNVTVVTPTYNRSALITRALESLRLQRVAPAHVIVVDDASTDGTPDVVRNWAEHHQFPVTVEVLPANSGPGAARNRGIELASTEYIAFLDSDDEHFPDTLQRLVDPLEAIPDAVVSFADATVVTRDLRVPSGLFHPHINIEDASRRIDLSGPTVWEILDPTTTLLNASIIPTSATCFRRTAALASGGMPEQVRSGEDWLFWLRMAQRGRFVFQTDDLALHHRHDANLTHNRRAEFVSREKLRGYLALEQGSLGIRLTPAQRARVIRFREEQLAGWRYHLSLLGLKAYLAGLRSDWLRSAGSPARQIVDDPKSLLRATFHAFS